MRRIWGKTKIKKYFANVDWKKSAVVTGVLSAPWVAYEGYKGVKRRRKKRQRR